MEVLRVGCNTFLGLFSVCLKEFIRGFLAHPHSYNGLARNAEYIGAEDRGAIAFPALADGRCVNGGPASYRQSLGPLVIVVGVVAALAGGSYPTRFSSAVINCSAVYGFGKKAKRS